VNFCAALLISAAMGAPWASQFPLGILLAKLGAAGFLYSLAVCHHARKSTAYNPEIEDWVWYAILPALAYVALGAGGVLLSRNIEWPLAMVAAVALLFLLIGIRNAWDTITYVVLTRRGKKRES